MGVAWRGVTGLQAHGEIIYHRSAVSRSQLAQSCRNLAVWRCRWTSLHRRLLYRSSGRALTDAGVLGPGRRAIHRSSRGCLARRTRHANLWPDRCEARFCKLEQP